MYSNKDWLCFAIVIVFSGHLLSTVNAAGRIMLYQDEHYRGGRKIVRVGPSECFNLDKAWNDEASSIDPQGVCVIVFQDHFCRGRGIRLEEGQYGTDQLVKLDFNDEISSLRLC